MSLNPSNMTEKELDAEVAAIMAKARDGSITASDAARLGELKMALNAIHQVTGKRAIWDFS